MSTSNYQGESKMNAIMKTGKGDDVLKETSHPDNHNTIVQGIII